jgi:predicted nucleic acid-binding protein
MIVIDASAALDLLLNTRLGAQVRARLSHAGQTIHAPHLLDVEVMQVLRRYWRNGALDDDRAAEAIQDYTDLIIERYSHELLIGRVWELRKNLTAYDGCYIALAELLDAPLLTSDARLANASQHRAKVDLIR